MSILTNGLGENPLTVFPLKNLFTVFVSNASCNLRCMYCSTYKSAFVKGLNSNSILDNRSMLTDFKRKVNSMILKVVGGGEVFLDNSLEEFLLSLSPMYQKIVVVTNGTLLTGERLSKLSKIKNLVVCLSLDGHLYEMNQYRFFDSGTFNKVFKVLHDIIESGIDIQINMVLHDKNSKEALAFFDYLINLKYALTVNMSPLIVKELSQEEHLYRSTPNFAVQSWQSNLRHIIDFYDKYSSILLPKAYYEALLDFIRKGFNRQSRCYIPYFEMPLFSSGKITPCPIIWNQEMGHFSRMSSDIYNEKIYRMLTKDGHFVPFCRHCFSSSDMFNLYMDDKIDINEIGKMPLYNNMHILSQIVEIKNTIQGEVVL